MGWEEAYDGYLLELHSRPSQAFCWFNHPLFPGQRMLVNYSYLPGGRA